MSKQFLIRLYFSILFVVLFIPNSYSSILLGTTPFITTWKTDNPGVSANNQITIPTATVGYNYIVDWGDGTTPSVETGVAIHTYAVAGTYTVSITGDFPGIHFANTGDKDKILSIEQWGDNPWESMSYSFWGCTNLVGNFVDAPDLSKVSSTQYMFARTTKFNTSLNNWDVSNVTEMIGMFNLATSFNGDISNWDVSNVVDMTLLFAGAVTFNKDVSNWQTGNVKSMRDMFYEATVFNQDISNWDVSNVTDMFAMFNSAESFNKNISSWNTSNVNDMSAMFAIATSFNQDLSAWDVSSVTNMGHMFSGAKVFNQDINNWNTSKVVNMQFMFSVTELFDKYIGDWDVSNVTNMGGMFSDAISFNQDLSNWDTSKVDRMQIMFSDTVAFNQDLSNWDTSNVIMMHYMFANAAAFNQDLSKWDVSNVFNMDGMFFEAEAFDQNIGIWNVESLTTAKSMFEGAKLSVENYDALLIGWNSQNLNKNVFFHGGNSKYCSGASARANMIGMDNWSINDDGAASPSIDPLMNQNEIGSFTLPTITGVDLFGNEAYYTGQSGTGIMYNPGEVVNYSDLPMYPVTLYIYGGYNVDCSSEQNFDLVITSNPLCTNLSSPLNGAINVSTDTDITWNAISDVIGYKLTVGTSIGATDVLNNFDVGNTTTYDLESELPESTTIFVTVIPYNGSGDVSGCQEESFTTEIVSKILTCTTLSSPTSGDIDVPINTDITWNAVPNATGYKLIIGTNSGAINILDNIDVGEVLSYNLSLDLPESTTIFVSIIPYNLDGEATGCVEEIFTTGININTELPPKFFTPNNDAINDYWIVYDTSNLITKIFIYNRYGKLLKQITNLSKGWDGTFNGEPMPVDDYWYLISYEDGTRLRGHFSLIR